MFFGGSSTLKKITITGQFGFVFETPEQLGTDHMIIVKLAFWKRFLSGGKRKAGDQKFLRFEKRLRKAQFGDGLVWTVSQKQQQQPFLSSA